MSRVAGVRDDVPEKGRTGRSESLGDDGPGAVRDGVRGQVPAALGWFARFVGGTLLGEWRGIVVAPVRELLRRGVGGVSLALLATFAVIFFHAIHQTPMGAVVVRLLGEVRADLPLPLALLRTPVSLFVPALDLPVWAGITQLFLAFALAELSLGRARTLVVAYATTLAGTLSVRVMIALGPGWWGLGLPPEIGQVLDTGPSAAVVGLFTYLAVIRRAPVLFAFTGGSMVLESVVKPNLAAREHLIAIGTAIVLGLLHGRLAARRPRDEDVLPATLNRGSGSLSVSATTSQRKHEHEGPLGGTIHKRRLTVPPGRRTCSGPPPAAAPWTGSAPKWRACPCDSSEPEACCGAD
ncbi:hypothetical protein ACQEVG_17060 [Streptomyces sp. CA-135486]|uniref:hypothetical protein n=1 Tax=Streptomyces sp. CA-135486 TaxID=3240049 RepID=UPI003D8CAC59